MNVIDWRRIGIVAERLIVSINFVNSVFATHLFKQSTEVVDSMRVERQIEFQDSAKYDQPQLCNVEF